MKTHQRLILSILTISIGIFLIGSGIFEPAELFIAFNIPPSAGKYMAFGGMGLFGWGIWQMMALWQDRQRTQIELVIWAQQERGQAISLGIVCMAIGAIVSGSLIWSFVGVMHTGSPMGIRPIPIAMGIGFGGFLVWLGGTLIKVAIDQNSKSN